MSAVVSSGWGRKRLAVLALALILGGSFLAQLFNTSFYATKVSRVGFETPSGRLSGLLYLPKGAGPADPRPAIVTTHGYLNSAEMQDAGAIELSRRGYVVLALDMYDHGHSRIATKFGKGSPFFSFWPTSLYDAVQYLYAQGYSLKDAAGNGIIAVAGHSMGGFSATMAMVSDEADFAKSGIRKIAAGLTMGSDYRWSSYLKVTSDVAAAAFGPRTVGKVAARYDEFFFDAEAAKTGQTVVRKDYLATKEGQEFLGFPAEAREGVLYTLPGGGRRVIYQPNEIHPWNHFSRATTARQIEFYAEAFKSYAAPGQAKAGLASGDQIWLYKELCEFAALIGFFLLFVPLLSTLLGSRPFSAAKVAPLTAIPAPATPAGRAANLAAAVFAALFPALFFPALMSKAGTGFALLKYGSLALVLASVAAGTVARRRAPAGVAARGAAAAAACALALFGLTAAAKWAFPTAAFFNSPTTNQILYWALVVTAMVAFITVATHYLAARPAGIGLASYGATPGWKAVLASFAAALAAVAAGYALLYLIDAVFVTDFRLWVWAVKTFSWSSLAACLRYAPFFFVYYLVTGISINASTARIEGWKGSLAACALNVGGLGLYLIAQYGALFATGKALYPDQALSSILLFALVPTLVVATLYTRRFFRETGNVYTGAFLNALLMTMISVANTTVYNGF